LGKPEPGDEQTDSSLTREKKTQVKISREVHLHQLEKGGQRGGANKAEIWVAGGIDVHAPERGKKKELD